MPATLQNPISLDSSESESRHPRQSSRSAPLVTARKSICSNKRGRDNENRGEAKDSPRMPQVRTNRDSSKCRFLVLTGNFVLGYTGRSMEKQMIPNVLKKIGFRRLALAAGVGFPLFMAITANAQAPAPPSTG